MKSKVNKIENTDPIALFLKKGVYLDCAFPFIPSATEAHTKVKRVISEMSPLERIMATRRMEVLAAYLNAAQAALVIH
jgi:hypothetical protein